MKHLTVRNSKTLLSLIAYIGIISLVIGFAMYGFFKDAKQQGVQTFERFSEQITWRVKGELGKYSDQILLLREDIQAVAPTNTQDFTSIMQRYLEVAHVSGIGYMTDDNATYSYDGTEEHFDLYMDKRDVYVYSYDVGIVVNHLAGKDYLVFLSTWDIPMQDKSVKALYLYVDMSLIGNMLEGTSYGAEGASLSLIDHKGNNVWHSDTEFLLKNITNFFSVMDVVNIYNDTSAEQIASRVDLKLSGLVEYGLGKTRRTASYMPIDANEWTLVVVSPTNAISDTSYAVYSLLLLGLGILSIVAIATWLLRKNIKDNIALQIANRESQFKDKFISNMSHEIRTPLNGIAGIIHLLKSKHLDNSTRENYYKIMEESTVRLKQIVDDILDVSAMDKKIVELTHERFDLYDVCQHQMQQTRFLLQSEDVDLRFDTTGLKDRFYMGDSKKINSILQNLLSNAAKFTKDGAITLRIAQENGELVFQVSDTGIGISEAFQKVIFDRFTQEDSTYNREQKGTGLGLAITADIVAHLKGHISVESVQSKGATFTVRLPMEVCPIQTIREEANRSEQGINLSGSHVLIVEDNRVNALIAKKLLEKVGIEVVFVATNGQEALDFLCKYTDPVDLILMDIRMPVMDGLEATRRIRASCLPYAQKIPIIALTANGLEHDQSEIRAVGMNDRLAKPIDTHDFYRTLEKYLRGELA